MAQFVGDQAGDGVELLLGIFGLQIHFKMLGHALDLGIARYAPALNSHALFVPDATAASRKQHASLL